MNKEIENILLESFEDMWGCKHLPCPETEGCLGCARDRILALFAERVRGLENPYLSRGMMRSYQHTGFDRFRAVLLKELES